MKLHASIYLVILNYSYVKIIFCFLSYFMPIKVLKGVCAEGFWMKADCFNEVRWLEGFIHSVKSSCSMLYLELTTSILPPLELNYIKRKMNSSSNFKNVWSVALPLYKVWWISQSVFPTWVIICVQSSSIIKGIKWTQAVTSKMFNQLYYIYAKYNE